MGLIRNIVDALLGKKPTPVEPQHNLYDVVGRPVVFLDFETTGVDAVRDRAIEIAGSRHDRNGRQDFHYLINPGVTIPAEVTNLTGITNEIVGLEHSCGDVLRMLEPWLGDSPVLVAHNAVFDVTVLLHEQRRAGITPWNGDFICTRSLATLLKKGMPSVNRAGRPYTSYRLGDVARALGLSLDGAHRAENDIRVTEEVFRIMYPLAVKQALPIVNVIVQPKWARALEFIPNRTRITLIDD